MLGVVVDIDGSVNLLESVEVFLDYIKVVSVVPLQVDRSSNVLQT